MGRVETVEGKNAMQRIMSILSDGDYHDKVELAQLGQCGVTMVAFHVCMARKTLPAGEAIICEYVNRKIGYRRIYLYNNEGAPFTI
jgi:hypothetical protein